MGIHVIHVIRQAKGENNMEINLLGFVVGSVVGSLLFNIGIEKYEKYKIQKTHRRLVREYNRKHGGII